MWLFGGLDELTQSQSAVEAIMCFAVMGWPLWHISQPLSVSDRSIRRSKSCDAIINNSYHSHFNLFGFNPFPEYWIPWCNTLHLTPKLMWGFSRHMLLILRINLPLNTEFLHICDHSGTFSSQSWLMTKSMSHAHRKVLFNTASAQN